MGKAHDFLLGGPRFKSHLSQYLPNFYWNFLKSGITGHGQIMCFLEILRSRVFRICGQSVWELKIHKIRRQGTVDEHVSRPSDFGFTSCWLLDLHIAGPVLQLAFKACKGLYWWVTTE